MSTALATKDNAIKTVAQYLNSENTKKYLEGVLKDRAGQFITSLVSLSTLTPGLAKCDPKTLMYCGLKAASMNLPLDNNLGFAYALPYKSKRQINGEWVEVTEAQFQAGYRTFVQLAQRTGQYKNINVLEIRQGELKKWDPFTEEIVLELIQDPELREKAVVIGYAGMFELVNGFRKVVYWTKEKVIKHAKRFSKTYNAKEDRFASFNKYKKEWIPSPWESDTDQMCKKTVLKDMISKWGPMSTEMAEAIKYDQSVIRKDDDGNEHPEYVDVSFEVADEPERPNDIGDEFASAQKAGALFGGAENAQVNP
jgi:recombination protein RecT